MSISRRKRRAHTIGFGILVIILTVEATSNKVLRSYVWF
jgi:hypothetical protein